MTSNPIPTPYANIENRLKTIDENLRALKDNFISKEYNAPGIVWRVINGKKVGFRNYGEWTERRSINFQLLYEHIETYAGTTRTLDLDFQVNTMLRRIEMIHNDDTAKTFEVRLFSDYNQDSSNYNILKSSTADQTVRWMQVFDNIFLPAGSRLEFYFSSYTAGKTNKIIIGVEEI